MKRQRAGQSSLETVLLMSLAVAAFVALAVYTQRAYQGYLLNNASAHGLQFDPGKTFLVNRTLQLNQTQEITLRTGPSVEFFGGSDELPSPPGGVATGRLSVVNARVTDDWELDGDATYESDRHDSGTGSAPPVPF